MTHDRFTSDAESNAEHEQLEALAAAARTEIALPADAFVVGEPVRVVAIAYDGHIRRGLRATVRRGMEHYDLDLADLVFHSHSEAARITALYRMWRELDAAKPPQTQADTSRVDLGQPLDLIVLGRKSNAIRCRVPHSQRELTLRDYGARCGARRDRHGHPDEAVVTRAPALSRWNYRENPARRRGARTSSARAST